MATIPDRDQTLINCPLAAPPHRNSDVDFHDVFGGPPRRHSAAFDPHRRRAGSLDSRPGGERGSGSRSSERPAFGESSSPSLRRHLGDDFFSDIFRGSEESSCSSPTRIDRDSNYPSSPGSRVLSPSRGSPLHRGNSFGGGSSLPAQLSLPMKSTKGIDQPTFNSPTHSGLYKKDGSPDSFGFPSFPSAYMQSSSTRAIPLTDDLRNDAHSSYRQSPLSRQVSRDLDKSSETTGSVSLSFEVKSQKDTTSLEDYVSSNQFHFSIYKWAGKGVTLIMPSSTKKKHDSRVRRIPEVVLHGVDLPSYNDNKPITIIASRRQSENHDRNLRDLIIDQNDDTLSSSVEEFLPVGFDSNSLHIDVTEESGNDIAPERSRRAPVTIHEGLSAEMRNPHQPFNDDKDRQGKEDVVTQVEETENLSRGQKNIFNDAEAKQQADRENSVNHVEESSPSMQDAQVPLEGKMNGNKVKGKVKEFIKIFNYEPSPKRNGMFETQDPRSKGKDSAKGKIENQVNTSTSKIAEEVKASSRIMEPSIVEEKGSSRIRKPSIVEEKASSRTESLVDTPTAGNKSLKTEKSDPTKFSDVDMINDSSSERKGTSGPFSESAPEIIDASIYNAVESHFEDFEDCLIEQLSQDKDGHLQTDQDQIKISDVKIREWAKGKEGNIRSLLSTLQYVLWEESGWKPVPLVSIIEGPSVKRAYQKALLYLHPDKLQQKGAAMHQRYIAEKVFDILQEAWDHFNSISSF